MSERLTASAFQPMSAGAEVHVLEQQVGGGEQAMTRRHRHHRGVVADPDLETRRAAGCDFALPDTADERALTQSAQTHPFGWFGGPHAVAATELSSRKFASSALPWAVRIDSGWNCTPSTG